MLIQIRGTRLLAALAVLALLEGCGVPAGPSLQEVLSLETPTPRPTLAPAPTRTPRPTPTATPSPTPEGLTELGLPLRCEVAGAYTYDDRERGFCFAYPPSFEAVVSTAGTPILYGPALDDSLEPVRASLLAEYIIPEPDATLDEAVDAYLTLYLRPDMPAVERSASELGGQPAVLLEGVPGREGSRDLFFFHNELLFHLLFLPSVREYPQAAPDVELLFETVTRSFALFTPEPAPATVLALPAEPATRRVEIHGAGLSVEVPAALLRLEADWVWQPAAESTVTLGVTWFDLGLTEEQGGRARDTTKFGGTTDRLEEPMVEPTREEVLSWLLPPTGVLLSSEPITLTWDSGWIYTMEVYAPGSSGTGAEVQSVETHALFVVPHEEAGAWRTISFYVTAGDGSQLEQLQAMLRRVLDSVESSETGRTKP